MPIVLLRVDERLIHGQVVVGWGNALHPGRIAVIDDELAESVWEQELYTLGLPDEVGAEFHTVAQARTRLDEWRGDPLRTVVLTRTVKAMQQVAAGGALRGEEVNIGGLHYAPGREELLPYVFLNAEERTAMRGLLEGGVDICACDVPGGRRVDLSRLLGPEP